MSLTLPEAVRRKSGSYYTPDMAAVMMARWVMERRPSTVLEPSFGDGVFLAAVEQAAISAGLSPELIGVELRDEAFTAAASAVSTLTLRPRLGDFLADRPPLVDAVIGNPPFVRLRNLDGSMRSHALVAAERAMGAPMEPSGSTWMPFVLHASEALNPGGCLALVLPYELTHVRYARPLWRYLGANFGRLRVVRSYDRVFTDILQDVVILLADHKGGSVDTIEFQLDRKLSRLESPQNTTLLSLDAVVNGDRAFTRALLPSATEQLVQRIEAEASVAMSDIAKVRIGYVSGDKRFFHPSKEVAQKFRLPGRSLVPTVGASRNLRGMGLFTSDFDGDALIDLWLPDKGQLTKGEQRYIDHGEDLGVCDAHKCAVRNPWFVVPDVAPPDVVFSVFSDTPLLFINDAGIRISNSHLGAYLHSGWTPQRLAANWYTSLTQLFIELEVHSLGGGVLVAVPRELGRVRVPTMKPRSQVLMRQLSEAVRSSDPMGPSRFGDAMLTKGGVVTGDEMVDLYEGLATLRTWRRRDDLLEDV